MGYTNIPDWLAYEDLTLLEALLWARVKRYGDHGCYETNLTLSMFLKVHPRTVQRVVQSLLRKRWIAAHYPNKGFRVLFDTHKQLVESRNENDTSTNDV
jgi:hypothetical protein